MASTWAIVVALLAVLSLPSAIATSPFLVGVGKGDITGPVADANLMGYANPTQFAGGILNRVYARALIVADAEVEGREGPGGGGGSRGGAGGEGAPPPPAPTRWVFVNLDACMGSQAVTFTVLERLRAEFGSIYSEQNLILSGTHTHSAPAGFLQHLVYGITSQGWIQATFDAIVDGVVDAVRAAHRDLAPRTLRAAEAEVLHANINRSPTAYVQNPPEERARYSHNIDKVMTVLAVFDDVEGGPGEGPNGPEGGNEGRRGAGSTPAPTPSVVPDPTSGDAGYAPTASELDLPKDARALFAWFPVHGTSVNNTNKLVNGDNKGAAAQLLERAVRAARASAASGGPREPAAAAPFVSAFCQANVGDTSPNTQGPYCGTSEDRCDAATSTCGGRVQDCIARGPQWPDNVASCLEIGARQASGAARAARAATPAASLAAMGGGGANAAPPRAVESRHAFLDMRNLTVLASSRTRAGVTCPPAMGFSFAAGTTDGPGAFDFTQGDTSGSSVLWRLVRDLLATPSAEQVACHAPKPILLDVGDMTQPWDWAPTIVELTVARAGAFVIVGVPGELTTMAGRRLRAAVRAEVGDAWGPDLRVVLAGLSNTYSSYVTTYEEYQEQRYEGAFTLFGPHTLDAYIQETLRLVRGMLEGTPTPPGPPPKNLIAKQWTLLPPVVADSYPWGSAFGKVLDDVRPGSGSTGALVPGLDTAKASFQSACPRNDIKRGRTFVTVERRLDGEDAATGAARRASASDASDAVPPGSLARGALLRGPRSGLTFLPAADGSGLPEPRAAGTAAATDASSRAPAANSAAPGGRDEAEATWEVVATDDEWETRFAWGRPGGALSPHSVAEISWIIPNGTAPGIYRLGHHGDWKHFAGGIRPFSGWSSAFEVAPSGNAAAAAAGPRGPARATLLTRLRAFLARATRGLYKAWAKLAW